MPPPPQEALLVGTARERSYWPGGRPSNSHAIPPPPPQGASSQQLVGVVGGLARVGGGGVHPIPDCFWGFYMGVGGGRADAMRWNGETKRVSKVLCCPVHLRHRAVFPVQKWMFGCRTEGAGPAQCTMLEVVDDHGILDSSGVPSGVSDVSQHK